MRKKIHRLVEDMTNSYGSMSQSFAQSYHQNRHFSSLGELLVLTSVTMRVVLRLFASNTHAQHQVRWNSE